MKNRKIARKLKRLIDKDYNCTKVKITETDHEHMGHKDIILIDMFYSDDNNIHRTFYFPHEDEFYFMYGSYTVVNSMLEKNWRKYYAQF